MLEGADHRDKVAVGAVILINIAEVHIQQRVAVCKKERRADFSLQQAKPAAGAHKDILIGEIDMVVLFQLVEIGLDHPLFVVDDHRKIMAAEVPEPVHDHLSDGLLPHRDQRLGQDLGVGVQPGAQTARHHDNGDIDLLAVVHIKAVGKDNIGDDAALVQHRQRVNAVFLQDAARLAALCHRDAERVVVRRVVNGLVGRAAPQEKLADVAIGDDGLQLALRRDEQNALAGLVQLAQCFQHRGGRFNKEFFNFYQGCSPFDV